MELVRHAVQAAPPRLTVTEIRAQIDHRSPPAPEISVDGEISARTPVTVTIARGAIEVAAPQDDQPSLASAAANRSASPARAS